MDTKSIIGLLSAIASIGVVVLTAILQQNNTPLICNNPQQPQQNAYNQPPTPVYQQPQYNNQPQAPVYTQPVYQNTQPSQYVQTNNNINSGYVAPVTQYGYGYTDNTRRESVYQNPMTNNTNTYYQPTVTTPNPPPANTFCSYMYNSPANASTYGNSYVDAWDDYYGYNYSNQYNQPSMGMGYTQQQNPISNSYGYNNGYVGYTQPPQPQYSAGYNSNYNSYTNYGYGYGDNNVDYYAQNQNLYNQRQQQQTQYTQPSYQQPQTSQYHQSVVSGIQQPTQSGSNWSHEPGMKFDMNQFLQKEEPNKPVMNPAPPEVDNIPTPPPDVIPSPPSKKEYYGNARDDHDPTRLTQMVSNPVSNTDNNILGTLLMQK